MKGGVIMPTSSITKEFVVKNEESAERLAALLVSRPKTKYKKSPAYENGKKSLKRLFGH